MKTANAHCKGVDFTVSLRLVFLLNKSGNAYAGFELTAYLIDGCSRYDISKVPDIYDSAK